MNTRADTPDLEDDKDMETPAPEEQGTGFLELSDEEIMQMAEGPMEPEAAAEEPPEEKEAEEESAQSDSPEADESEEESAQADSDEDSEAVGESDSTEEEASAAEETGEEGIQGETGPEDGPAIAGKSAEEAADEGKQETPKDTADTVDYKAEYEKLLAPFKANGRQMQVNSVDDAVTLMKMGANYNKKMQAIKPSLKVARMLQKNDLLDEDKISFLIDLHKKDPAAIQKLVKESGIDPVEIDTEAKGEYTPGKYKVSDKEMDVEAVLLTIEDSPKFDETIEVITRKMDSKSRETIIDNPQLITVINAQLEDGTYEKITDVVETERALGRLVGLSDLEAYKLVGDAMMQAQQEAAKKETPPAPAATAQADTKPAINKAKSDPKLTKQKRAAGTTKAKPVHTPTYDPLAMPDSEFENIEGLQYL